MRLLKENAHIFKHIKSFLFSYCALSSHFSRVASLHFSSFALHCSFAGTDYQPHSLAPLWLHICCCDCPRGQCREFSSSWSSWQQLLLTDAVINSSRNRKRGVAHFWCRLLVKTLFYVYPLYTLYTLYTLSHTISYQQVWTANLYICKLFLARTVATAMVFLVVKRRETINNAIEIEATLDYLIASHLSEKNIIHIRTSHPIRRRQNCPYTPS